MRRQYVNGIVKVFMTILFSVVLSLGCKISIEAYTFNASTYQVSSYQGVNGTGCGYSGQETYINLWDADRTNTMKSAKVTIYKNGNYDIGDSYTAAGYFNYLAFAFTFYNTGDYTYYLSGTCTDGSTFDGSGSFHIYDQEPVISSHPSSKTVKEGTSATFSTGISSGTHVSYQWYWNTSGNNTSGTKIDGATSSSYTISGSDVTSSLNGRYYYCVLSNDGYTRCTNTAKLTVQYAPVVRVNSTSVYVYSGDTYDFSVDVSGGNPSQYRYQWYYASSLSGNKTYLAGATSSTYRMTADSTKDSRYYFCRVQNGDIFTWSSGVKVGIKYRIKYDGNGGYPVPDTQTKYHNLKLYLDNTIPRKAGYIFQGWADSYGGTTAKYFAGSIYNANENDTLYAIWEKDLSVATPTPIPTPGLRPAPTLSPRPTSTPTLSPRPTSTPTLSSRPTATPTLRPTRTATPTLRPTRTPTPRPTSTPSLRPTPTPTSTSVQSIFPSIPTAVSTGRQDTPGPASSLPPPTSTPVPSVRPVPFPTVNPPLFAGATATPRYENPSATTKLPTETKQATEATPQKSPADRSTSQAAGKTDSQKKDKLKVGTKFTYGKLYYKVTRKKKAKGEVTVLRPKSTKVKKLTVPNYVNKKGISFQVTGLGAGAFSKCRKLKYITIEAKNLKYMGKKAFRGVAQRGTRISVPRSKKKKYAKMFNKAK